MRWLSELGRQPHFWPAMPFLIVLCIAAGIANWITDRLADAYSLARRNLSGAS
jgi:hypothetical protein